VNLDKDNVKSQLIRQDSDSRSSCGTLSEGDAEFDQQEFDLRRERQDRMMITDDKDSDDGGFRNTRKDDMLSRIRQD
jgi:hypothetical protein